MKRTKMKRMKRNDHVQSIPELEQALREYTEQMKDIDQLEDGPEKAEMKTRVKDLVELTREVLKERAMEETKKKREKEANDDENEKRRRTPSRIEKELEDLENLRQTEEEEQRRGKERKRRRSGRF